MKWEYLTISPFAEKTPWGDKLNQLGQEGWELITVIHPRWVFKRTIEEPTVEVKERKTGSTNRIIKMARMAIEEKRLQNENG